MDGDPRILARDAIRGLATFRRHRPPPAARAVGRCAVAKMLYLVTMSLDGFIAGPGGDMSWLAEHLGPNAGVTSSTAGSRLLVGNRTFCGDGPHRGTPGKASRSAEVDRAAVRAGPPRAGVDSKRLNRLVAAGWLVLHMISRRLDRDFPGIRPAPSTSSKLTAWSAPAPSTSTKLRETAGTRGDLGVRRSGATRTVGAQLAPSQTPRKLGPLPRVRDGFWPSPSRMRSAIVIW